MAVSDLNHSDFPRSSRGWGWRGRAWVGMLCVVIGLFYVWTARNENVSWHFEQRQTDYYNLLTEGFLDGHLYMNLEVPQELLKLADPYNPANRPPGVALHDASMYRGHYYLYFGAAPVVTLLVPFRLLAGIPLPLPAAVVTFTWAGFMVSVALLGAIRRRYFPKASLLVTSFCVLALGTASMGPLLVLRSSVWELPLSGGYFFAMVALYCVFRSLHALRRAAWWFAGAGLSLGLAVASRPTYLYTSGLLAAPLAWWFWQERQARRNVAQETAVTALSPWKMAIAGLVPLGVMGMVMALYNYARFGSFTEFGVAYQFSGIFEAETKHFRWSYFPLNWRMYFLQPADWSWYFPFIHRAESPAIPAGHLGFDDLYGVLVNAPLVWLAGLAPLAGWRRSADEQGRLAAVLAVLALVVAGALATLLFFYAAMARYGADFMPTLLLLASVGAMASERWAVENVPPWRVRVAQAGVGVLALGSAFYAVMLSAYAYGNLKRLSPETYARLATTLNRPSQWRDQLMGTVYGPVEVELRVPTGHPPAGTRESLVSTGAFETGDHVFVQYEEAGRVRLGYAHDGGGLVLSRLTAPESGATWKVRVEMGSLYPPEEHPFFAALSEEARLRLARRVRVWLGDELMLDSYQRFHESAPGDVVVARAKYRGTEMRRFSGEWFGSKRTGSLAEVLAEKTLRQALRVRLAEGVGAVRQPLGTAGEAGDGALRVVWYLKKEEGSARIGCVADGKMSWETAAFETDFRAGHEVELEALPAPGRATVVAVKWDGVIVGTCPVGVAAVVNFSPGKNEVRAREVAANFQGALQSADEDKGISRFDTIRLTVMFPEKRNPGREPLVVTGETGRGDFVFVEYLDDGHLRFGLDHWGKATAFGPPVAVDFASRHVIEVSLDSFPGAMGGAVKREPGRVRVAMDGREAWTYQARLYAVKAEDVFVGRNPIGGAGEPPFMGTILAVKRMATDAGKNQKP